MQLRNNYDEKNKVLVLKMLKPTKIWWVFQKSHPVYIYTHYNNNDCLFPAPLPARTTYT